MAGSDLIGLSLNAERSHGDDLYGEYDRVGRGDLAWQTHTIGHLEWSSLDNLAQYGWDLFKTDGFKNARGLGWPLHAIGDAAALHHVVGTTSWGHRPYEDYVNAERADLIQGREAGIVLAAFYWWSQLRSHGDVRRFITDLAWTTRAPVRFQGEWAFDDDTSVDYIFGSKWSAQMHYASFREAAGDMLQEGIGATLGFLVWVSTQVEDPGFYAAGECPENTRYDPAEARCVDMPVIIEDAGTGGDSGQCLPGVQGCGSGERCPTGQFCNRGCCTNVPH